jgi:hypothetical protein
MKTKDEIDVEGTQALTLKDIAAAIQIARSEEGFHEFRRSIEDQLIRMAAADRWDRKLHFSKDVSGGCKQAFLACWVRIEHV